MKVILASASPRRSMILEQSGIPFSVIVSETDETINCNGPEQVVMELSKRKAEDVAKKCPGKDLVIGADTVVAAGGKILGKPKDAEDAAAMIRLISGSVHQVFTGVTLVHEGKSHTFYAVTDVTVADLSEAEIDSYVNSGEPFDKAGAYAIQGLFGKYITGIRGEYNNVVGLPVAMIVEKCRELKIPLTE